LLVCVSLQADLPEEAAEQEVFVVFVCDLFFVVCVCVCLQAELAVELKAFKLDAEAEICELALVILFNCLNVVVWLFFLCFFAG
jgi:hypothetical protein